MRVGQSFDNVIQRALNEARCIIVVWSKNSVESEWVKNEAMVGFERSCLLPIRIDEAEIPIAFRRIQAADFLRWDPSSQELEELLEGVAKLLNSTHTPVVYLPQKRSWRVLVTSTVAMLVLAFLYFFVGPQITPLLEPQTTAPVVSPATIQQPVANSIAVLKFADLSQTGNQAALAAGIADEILNELAGIPELHVIARTSSFMFDSDNHSIKEIGEKLNVRHVLEGSVMLSDKTIRITTQLIDTETEFHVWSKSFDREMVNVFSIYDDVAAKVAETLEVILVENEKTIPSAPTTDIAAYQLYLKAGYLGYSLGNYGEALELLEEALERDGSFARALLSKARTNQILASIGIIRPEVGYETARTGAEEALKIDSSLHGAYELLGEIQLQSDLDFRMANKSFERAAELTTIPITGRGTLLFFIGQYKEALEIFAAIEEINPFDIYNKIWLGRTLAILGYKEEATQRYDEALEIAPSNIYVVVSSAVHFATEMQNYKRSSELLEVDLSTIPGREVEVLWGLGTLQIEQGDPTASRSTLNTILEYRKTQYVSPLFIQNLYWRQGNFEEHIKWMAIQLNENAAVPWIMDFFNLTPDYWDQLASWAVSEQDKVRSRLTMINHHRDEVERIMRKMTL